jgi:hypothetical protein
MAEINDRVSFQDAGYKVAPVTKRKPSFSVLAVLSPQLSRSGLYQGKV